MFFSPKFNFIYFPYKKKYRQIPRQSIFPFLGHCETLKFEQPKKRGLLISIKITWNEIKLIKFINEHIMCDADKKLS